MGSYDMGLDVLGAADISVVPANVPPVPVVVNSKVRIESPWWHDAAIVVGALASIVTLWKVGGKSK